MPPETKIIRDQPDELAEVAEELCTWSDFEQERLAGLDAHRGRKAQAGGCEPLQRLPLEAGLAVLQLQVRRKGKGRIDRHAGRDTESLGHGIAHQYARPGGVPAEHRPRQGSRGSRGERLQGKRFEMQAQPDAAVRCYGFKGRCAPDGLQAGCRRARCRGRERCPAGQGALWFFS
jgi:hypothetical protein